MTELSAVHQELVDTVPLAPGARIEGEPVAYEHEGQALEGYAAYDASIEGRRPAVLVVHDWHGLQEYPKARAQMLARLGYFAFAVDVYGAGRRFDSVEEASAEARSFYRNPELLRARVRAGYDRAVTDPRADPERVAVIGYCFGGSAALEFARTGAPLAGTVSFHGGLVAHEPPDVARISGSLLIATGAADPVVPDEAVVAFQNELRTRDDLDWQVTVYSGAPHAFTLPGTPNHRPAADRRSWRELEAFLAEVFAR
jgi:dienelactone hydrolase